MKEVIVNGKTFQISDELEKGEMELDLMNHEQLDDTFDLSDTVIELNQSLDDTLTDMGTLDYE